MNNEETTYFLFHHHGKVAEISEAEFKRYINELTDQWEDENGDLGQWYLPVLPDEFMTTTFIDETISINKEAKDGNSLEWGINQKVSDIFKDEIIGPCLLKAKPSKVKEVRNKFIN